MPEIKEAIQDSEQRLRDTTLSHFDTIYRRFDRLEVEYHALAAAVGRIELRIGAADREPSPVSIADELRQLRERVAELQRRIDEIEASAS